MFVPVSAARSPCCRLGIPGRFQEQQKLASPSWGRDRDGDPQVDSWVRSMPELQACPPGTPRQLGTSPWRELKLCNPSVPPMPPMPSQMLEEAGVLSCWGSAAGQKWGRCCGRGLLEHPALSKPHAQLSAWRGGCRPLPASLWFLLAFIRSWAGDFDSRGLLKFRH